MKLGKQCEWKDIKIGEIFAYTGCTIILYKVSDYSAITLAYDESIFDVDIEGYKVKWIEIYDSFEHRELCTYSFGSLCTGRLYKLSESIQRLWKGKG